MSLQLNCLLREKHEQAVLEALKHLPTDLDKTYQRMLDLIDGQTKSTRALAYRILEWVLYAEHPLRMEELRQAVSIFWTETGEIKEWDFSREAIVESCCNLLAIENDVLRPIHYSVREFLLGNSFSSTRPMTGSAIEHLRNPQDARTTLAIACLYFCQKRWLEEGPCLNEGYLDERHTKAPFLWHASRFFDRYLDKDRLRSSPSLRRLVERLLERNMAHISALIQFRVLQDPFDKSSLVTDFDPLRHGVDATTILYTTQLYAITDILPGVKKLSDMRTPKFTLHYVARVGDLKAVKRVLADGHEVDERDHIGATALYYAARSGSYSVCRLLVARGACVDITTRGGSTPLHVAAAGGHTRVVKLLLQDKAVSDQMG